MRGVRGAGAGTQFQSRPRVLNLRYFFRQQYTDTAAAGNSKRQPCRASTRARLRVSASARASAPLSLCARVRAFHISPSDRISFRKATVVRSYCPGGGGEMGNPCPSAVRWLREVHTTVNTRVRSRGFPTVNPKSTRKGQLCANATCITLLVSGW